MKNTALFLLILTSSLALLAADNTALIKSIEAQAITSGSDNLIILENDNIIYENHFGQHEKVQSVQSVTKSISAMAVAILLDMEMINSYDVPMYLWISEWKNDSEKSKITLRMILNHTSGLPDADQVFFAQPDLVKAAIETPLVAAPGTQYLYSSVATILLGEVISKNSHMAVDEFINHFIFKPLSIANWHWNKDLAGHFQTAGGLYLNATDMSKIGTLMLHQGAFEGWQVLSPYATQTMLIRSQNFADYGLLWWLYGAIDETKKLFKVFSAYGWGGQFISVFPDKHVVAIRTRDPLTIDPNQLKVQGYPNFPEMLTGWH